MRIYHPRVCLSFVAALVVCGTLPCKLYASESLGTSNVPVADRLTPDQVKSDSPDTEFKYLGFYFSSANPPTEPSKFINSLSKCVAHAAKAAKSQGQGYKVLKSLGHSDEKIISDSTTLCMEAKGWFLHKRFEGRPQRTDYLGRRYDSISERELEFAKNLLISQLAWFKKYAPEVLDD